MGDVSTAPGAEELWRRLAGAGGAGAEAGAGAGAGAGAVSMAAAWFEPMLQRQTAALKAVVSNGSCSDAISATLEAFGGLWRGHYDSAWALRMLDASGKAPQGFVGGNPSMLGDYDECVATRAPPPLAFQGQYCVVRACHAPHGRPCVGLFYAEAAARAQEALAQDRVDLGLMSASLEGLPLKVGLCVPSACGPSDVKALAEQVLAPLPAALRVEIGPSACRTAGDESFGAAEYAVIAMILLVMLWSIVASIYDYTTRGRRRNEWMVAFSALANAAAVLLPGGGGGSGSEGGRGGGRDALPPLHALRVISFLGVVLGHSFVSFLDFPSTNLQVTLDEAKELKALVLAICPLSVDVFLVLSGLLVAYVFFNHMAQGGVFQIAPFYIYRYVRLAPALAVLLLLQSTVLLKLNDGPLWRTQHAHQCPETWWYIMLHICNYFRPQTVRCLGHLWYLSLDWHLYLLSPLALLALRRRPRAALAVLGLLSWGSVAARFYQAYTLRLRAPWTSYGVQEGMKRLYFPTHSRYEPYVIGIMLGYLLHRLKRRSTPLVIPRAWAISAWAVILGLMALDFWYMWKIVDPSFVYERLSESLFVAFVHFIIAVSIAGLVYMTMAGYAGWFGDLLSHSWWRPFSRLTFCMYLVHYPVLHSLVWSQRAPGDYNLWSIIRLALTCWFLCLPVALTLAVLFECPAVQLARILLAWHSGKTKKELPEKRQRNGVYAPLQTGEVKADPLLREIKSSKE